METITSVTVWSHVDDAHLSVPSGVLPAGALSVQPAAAKVGQSVTLSGRTVGGEVFLPPFVQMASVKLHTVSRSSLVQCGGAASEPVAFGQVVNSGPYLAKGAPAGMAWQASFRIPARLTTYSQAGKGGDTPIPTPPGVYRLVAAFGPAFFCPAVLPTTHGQFVLAANVTVLP